MLKSILHFQTYILCEVSSYNRCHDSRNGSKSIGDSKKESSIAARNRRKYSSVFLYNTKTVTEGNAE